MFTPFTVLLYLYVIPYFTYIGTLYTVASSKKTVRQREARSRGIVKSTGKQENGQG